MGDAAYLRAFTPGQLQALAYKSLRTHVYGFGFGLIFFGVECIVLGYLIFQTFARVIYPPLATRLFPAVMTPPFVAVSSLAPWFAPKKAWT